MRGASEDAGRQCGARGIGRGVARAALVHPTLRLDDVDIRLKLVSINLRYICHFRFTIFSVFRWFKESRGNMPNN
jgi:hypothetical protein